MSEEKHTYLNKENVIFLSFEGIEGCGKTTQIDLITNHLKNNNIFKVQQFREPGGTMFGEKLREAMLSSGSKVSPLAEAHLFASSRSQLLDQKVLPLLDTKKNLVIYDRYIHSSIAYQGYGSELGAATIMNLHQTYPLTIMPHLTLYLEIDVETSKMRQNLRSNKKDYFESKPSQYYDRLLHGFNYCKENFPSFKTINGNQSQQDVFQDILKMINSEIK